MSHTQNHPEDIRKMNLSPCLTKHHAKKAYGGVEVQLHALISALDGGEWTASCPDRVISGERAHDTHWIGRWVGPRAGLDAVAKRKNPKTCRELNPGRSSHYTD